VTQIFLERNISKTAGYSILAILYLVCCEAIRSAILAKAWLLVVVRCYAEHGIATASRPSVMLRYSGHINWDYSKTICWLSSIGFLLCRPQQHGSTPKKRPQNFGRKGWAMERVALGAQQLSDFKINDLG